MATVSGPSGQHQEEPSRPAVASQKGGAKPDPSGGGIPLIRRQTPGHTAGDSSGGVSSQLPPRWAWVLIMVLGAIIVGGFAGVLTYASEPSVPLAILAGGGSFATTIFVMLAIAAYLRGSRG